MSFTKDELESFNTILEQRLLAQRQELELGLDRRLSMFQHGFESRFATLQQELMHDLTKKLGEVQHGFDRSFAENLDALHDRLSQTVEDMFEQRMHLQRQHIENGINRMQVMHLQGVEQLLQQHISSQSGLVANLNIAEGEYKPGQHFDSIEVQTELPMDILIEAFNRSLNERFAALHELTREVFKQWEEFLQTRLHTLSNQLLENLPRVQDQASGSMRCEAPIVLQGIEQLERAIESMQGVMSANQAMLSNRLHQHQQLPLERAHIQYPTPIQPLAGDPYHEGFSNSEPGREDR